MTVHILYVYDMNKRLTILFKKVTHNILVYGQVQIIVAVTSVLYRTYEIDHKEYNFDGFRQISWGGFFLGGGIS